MAQFHRGKELAQPHSASLKINLNLPLMWRYWSPTGFSEKSLDQHSSISLFFKGETGRNDTSALSQECDGVLVRVSSVMIKRHD